ncbi:alkene reductase [Streptomyces shenzhenensis]|uniref:Alkene reductase n=1 Tax=Streptomyces shenzhenensis TaxID=943815 RepID=A0A3M0I2J2_9ACTN|nr:alkene reductase [Streptomyces shenzhenensis]RMB82974.1 alkene reductase [Streptomyces shenzhenensis]
MSGLFDPVPFGGLTLPNRIVMSPMGRGRTSADGTPLPVMAEYYAQRATAGLVISEATHPSPVAVGHAHSVRLHTAEQARAWDEIVHTVHSAGGRMYLQIMHAGRISHPDLHGEVPVAPSAVRADGVARIFRGKPAYPMPRPLTADTIAATIEDFARCASTAARIGFDGVEIHGANGYLLHQFLSPVSNVREDEYGGDAEGRIRFTLEVARAIAAEIGPERTGIRLSPGFPLNDMSEPDRADVYPVLLDALDALGLGHVHFVAGSDLDLVHELSRRWRRTVVVNAGTGPLDTGATLTAADKALADSADLLSFGRQFLANPDLPERLRTHAPLNAWNPRFFYEGGSRGYTDYPVLAASAAGPAG